MMQWYYATESREQVGPLSEAEFRQALDKGTIVADTLVWNPTMKTWKKYSEVAGSQPTPDQGRPAASTCSECGRTFSLEDMIRYENAWVCAACKPEFVQKLKEGVSTAGTMAYAGFWIRFGAKFIDGIVISLVYFGLVFLLGLLLSSTLRANASHAILILALNQLIGLAIGASYSSWFLGRFAATPGKMACGLKVVSSEGRAIGYGRGFGRYFAELLSSIIMCIGYIMAGFDSQKRALHDRICDTRVIRK